VIQHKHYLSPKGPVLRTDRLWDDETAPIRLLDVLAGTSQLCWKPPVARTQWYPFLVGVTGILAHGGPFFNELTPPGYSRGLFLATAVTGRRVFLDARVRSMIHFTLGLESRVSNLKKQLPALHLLFKGIYTEDWIIVTSNM
jgi:hypothetical protein